LRPENCNTDATGFCCKNEEKVKERNVHASPKQTAKCNKRRRRELSSQHALEVSNRRARVAEMAASGLELRQCEELLKQEGFRHTDMSSSGAAIPPRTIAPTTQGRSARVKNDSDLGALERLTRRRSSSQLNRPIPLPK